MSDQTQDSPNSRHVAYFDVSFELLAELLYLPGGAKIERVGGLDDLTIYKPNAFRVVVSHPNLPVVWEGQVIPRADPSHSRDDQGNVSFKDWGLPK